MCIRIYIFSFKKKKKKKKTKKSKKLKKKKGISVENLTEFDEIVCEFDLCTFKANVKKVFVSYPPAG